MLTPQPPKLTNTAYLSALRFALTKSTLVKESISDINSALNYMETAARALGLESIQIGEIQVRHIKLVLDECHKTNKNFSTKRFNKVKAYISSLFKYLIEVGAATGNMSKLLLLRFNKNPAEAGSI